MHLLASGSDLRRSDLHEQCHAGAGAVDDAEHTEMVCGLSAGKKTGV